MTQPSASPAAHPTGGVPKTRQLARSKSHRRSSYAPPEGALPQLIFDGQAQCFKAPGGEMTSMLVEQMDRPLSVTFQLTRDCNFSCTYCSEPPGIGTRSYEEVLAMLDKLSGMRRIIEPISSCGGGLPVTA